jgi:hypothetical protein
MTKLKKKIKKKINFLQQQLFADLVFFIGVISA